jgi:hypothetical protein
MISFIIFLYIMLTILLSILFGLCIWAWLESIGTKIKVALKDFSENFWATLENHIHVKIDESWLENIKRWLDNSIKNHFASELARHEKAINQRKKRLIQAQEQWKKYKPRKALTDPIGKRTKK